MGVELVLDCRNRLGESVLWDAARGELFWVNIHDAEIWRFAPELGTARTHKLPERVGAIGLRQEGGLVVGLESGFALFDPDSEELERLQQVEAEIATTRLNDGRCDRRGRFICGGMNEAAESHSLTAVYRLDTDRSVCRIIDGISCANSICFSLDGTTMYFSDMPSGQILAYDYDMERGEVSNPRVFCDGSGQPGLPDGSIIDAEGCLWNARWGGGRVVRYAPDGSVNRVIEVPASNVSCIGFGKEDFRTLFITTARIELSPAQLTKEPAAGGVFAVQPGVEGVPEPRFRG